MEGAFWGTCKNAREQLLDFTGRARPFALCDLP